MTLPSAASGSDARRAEGRARPELEASSHGRARSDQRLSERPESEHLAQNQDDERRQGRVHHPCGKAQDMWQDGVKAGYRRNRRLIQGCTNAGGTAMLLLAIGYALATFLPVSDPIERVLVNLAVGLIVSIIFGLWTVRSMPRYPQTPLEYHQEQVERSVVKEWGKAIGWLRETVASAEESSVEIIQIHKSNQDDGVENTLRDITLITMHNRLCNLARAVADLCQRGHAEAAFIVWRSIFEIEVNMAYVSQDETGIRAERFQDWGMAAYLRLNSPDSSELESLKVKYPRPNQLEKEIGWTRERNPMGVPARARTAGYADKEGSTELRKLNMYEESSAYSHNDAIALLNDLGSDHPLRKGPSDSGHDMPLCLTATSLSAATLILVNSLKETERAELTRGSRLVHARSNEVLWEVAAVPERLLSRFRGFDMTVELPTEDGGTLVGVPYRRESTPEDMLREFINLRRREN